MNTSERPAESQSVRLQSLDAFRGFIMLAMVSGGLGATKIAKSFDESAAPSRLWEILAHQLDHVAWTGCGFWDLIQPAFMFMVGVALPYSYARRRSQGQSVGRILVHAAGRSALLVLLAVFLSSTSNSQTNWVFTNVLAQIGLGYMFLFVILGRNKWLQFAAVAVVLIGYWLAFLAYPLPPDDFNWGSVGISDNWELLRGLAAHWNKGYNFAAAFDRWFLNLFPRAKPFQFNVGGYQTLNFVPSLATMAMGLIAGELLMSQRTPIAKRNILFVAGAACLVFGLAVDHTIWPNRLMDVIDAIIWRIAGPTTVTVNPDWSLCPIVKRLWTPSWAIFSAGWTLWLLAFFYWVIEIEGYRGWSFPLVVVGLNSIAAYCMSQLLKPWVSRTLTTHFGSQLFQGTYWGFRMFSPEMAPMAESVAFVLFVWLVCWWMYRRKLFLKI